MSDAIDEARLTAIARTVHEAIRAWKAAHGQEDMPDWEAAEPWMRDSTLESVRFAIEVPDAPESAQHDQWVEQKKRDGWRYGAVKDATAKTHPMLVAFDALPDVERRKDGLIHAITRALA
jgi:hypothetical protein